VWYRSRLLSDRLLRRSSAVLLSIAFALVAWIALLGILVNKAAPLE
jgi:hypothetical protein